MHSNSGPANPWKKCPRRWHLKAFRLRIRSCLGVSHKFLRERTKLLEMALVCIKKPLRQKKIAFRRSNKKIWLRASKKMKLLIFYQAWKHLVTCNGTHDYSRWGISWERTHSNMHSNWGPTNPWKKWSPAVAPYGVCLGFDASQLVEAERSIIESTHGYRLNHGHMYSLAL